MEFQGGEPLLNWELLKEMVIKAERQGRSYGKAITFVIATNLALLTDEILDFCKEHNVRISTSLDGPAFIHDSNRPRPGRNSYELTIAGIRRAREALGVEKVAALMTTSRLSLDYPVEIIDEYVRQGFRSIFLRPISPYGFAVRTRDRTGYDFEKFMAFYKRGLDYILDLNRRGIDFQEAYAKIILTKILTPFPTGYVDLQSPAGLGTGVIVYNYDGDVYASDEARMLAEMGDKRFRLGNVRENSYREIFLSDALTSTMHASCVEALPGCADCAFQPYCGADPIYHHTVQGDVVGHRPTSEFHKRNYETIKLLFQYLVDAGPEIRRIFLAWVTDRSTSEIRPESTLA
jgi:His-Xaa-Ser system radical SAM maturase HxsB